jgi:hypothetical protein
VVVVGFGALKLFSFRCFSYPDLSEGGFGAPNSLGAGVEGDKAGALKLFIFCCLYVVVVGFGALKLFSFRCFSYPD